MTDHKSPEQKPKAPKTRSGTRKAPTQRRLSAGSVEQQGPKRAPVVITPGASSTRIPRPVTTPVASSSAAAASVTTPIVAPALAAPPAPPPKRTKVEYSGLVVTIGTLVAETLAPGTFFRIAERLAHQHANGIHPYDVVLERRLLANPTDDLKLSLSISNTYKGDSKPLEEEIDLGSDSVLGTLHWRTRKPTGGHLAQGNEGTDRDIDSRSFAWAVPLSTTWPPPLIMGPKASDNTVWEFELQSHENEQETLDKLADQLDSERYCGLFFAKVRTDR
jgi:hypothetical protein